MVSLDDMAIYYLNLSEANFKLFLKINTLTLSRHGYNLICYCFLYKKLHCITDFRLIFFSYHLLFFPVYFVLLMFDGYATMNDLN